MTKFSKTMFFMLLGCFLPFVSNAKIEKVESYVWTGFKGGAACDAVDQVCEYENGFKANGCPIIDTKYDGLTSYKFKGCGTGSSKLVCDGKNRNGEVLTTTCDCPSGMTDITSIYLNKSDNTAKVLFHKLYTNAGDVLKIFNYEELRGENNYESKQKVCADLNKLKCKYGSLKSSDIITMLGIKSINKPTIKDLDGDNNTDNSYNEYTFYNDKPNFGIKTTGFQFNEYVCLDDENLKIQGICTTHDCDKIKNKLGHPLISTTDLDCGLYVLKEKLIMTLWNKKQQPIYYCGDCDTSDNDDNDYVINYSNPCEHGHDVYKTGIEYAGFINSEWKINLCKKCRNQCSGYPSPVASGLYLYIEQPNRHSELIAEYQNGADQVNYCPITCPTDTDVAFATTTPEISASASGITSAMFDKCGDYSRAAAEEENGGEVVSEYLLYDVTSVKNIAGTGTLVCANAVSCNYAENYVERVPNDSPRWCSFWSSKDVEPTGYSNECGCKKSGYTFLCDGTGQTGVGAFCEMGGDKLYKSCNCSTKGYTKTCTGTGQEGVGEYCELPSGQQYYQSCQCRYTLTCSASGQIGVGAYCTDDNGVKYYKQCGSSEPAEPEVPDSGEEVYNYCPIGDNIRDTVLCHINALQEASESGTAIVKDYYGDKSEFIPVNQTIQLVPLVIKSKDHYNSVYKMLEKFTDGQPALMYYDGKNWIADESLEYKESLKYAINPYVYSYKFIEQGIHWIKNVNGDSSQFEKFSEIMSKTNDNLKSPGDVINIVDNYSYIVNLFNEKEGAVMTYIHPRLGGIFPGDEFFNAAEEGIGYFYIPNLETSLENLQNALDKLELKVEDLKPDDKETMFWYYLVNGYLQVEEKYYPQ